MLFKLSFISSSLPLYPSIRTQTGTGGAPVQSALRWNCDVKLADRICNFNRNWAEFAGYYKSETTFLTEVKPEDVTTFYDSVTGKPLFKAPVGRSFDEFKAESAVHGWPSFRDSEVCTVLNYPLTHFYSLTVFAYITYPPSFSRPGKLG